MSSQAAQQPMAVAVALPHDDAHHDHGYHGYRADDGYHAPADPVTRTVTRLLRRLPVWLPPLSILVCFLGGVAYVLWERPADATATSSPSCLIRLTTGYDCPGCGGTRAFWFLLHGNVPAAARSHLVAVFAAPFLAYMYLTWAVRAVFGWKLPVLRPSPAVISGFLGVWAAFAVLRNLPWAPFTWFYV